MSRLNATKLQLDTESLDGREQARPSAGHDQHLHIAYPGAIIDEESTSETDIRMVQEQLQLHGYDVAVDGSYGRATLEAVRRFQTSQSLEPAGAVGPTTWSALFSWKVRQQPAPALCAGHSYCPVASGLDIIGDRWVLLICPELALGDQRFTDLRTLLPGITPNLLSERLRKLQAAGLVTTAELLPPAARTVHKLTIEGRRVVPVLRAVARFGAVYLDDEPADHIDAGRAANALLVPWWRAEQAGGSPRRIRLFVGDPPVDLVRWGATVRVEPPSEDRPDAALRTTVTALAEARRTGRPLRADIDGCEETANAISQAFYMPIRGARRPDDPTR